MPLSSRLIVTLRSVVANELASLPDVVLLDLPNQDFEPGGIRWQLAEHRSCLVYSCQVQSERVPDR